MKPTRAERKPDEILILPSDGITEYRIRHSFSYYTFEQRTQISNQDKDFSWEVTAQFKYWADLLAYLAKEKEAKP